MTPTRREALRKAENLVSRGKLEAAVRQYQKVLRADAGDTSTLNRVGDLYVRLKRLDEATELFRRAGEHFSREGFYVKAIAIFKKIIRLDPTRIDVYEILADLYHRQGLINEARTQYQVVADYYHQNGETAKVIQIHERMVELEPDHPTFRVRLAELYCGVERTADAMQQYREIATFMLAHGKVEEAARVYQGAVDLDPKDQTYLSDAVLHLKEEGYPAAASELLAYGVSRNPDAAGIAVLTGLGEQSRAAEEETAAEPEPAPAPEVAAEELAEPAPEPEAPLEVEPEVTAVEPESRQESSAEEEVAPVEVSDESPASEPAVFLDLEEAGEVPYAVEREPPREDETGEIKLDLTAIDAMAAVDATEMGSPEPEVAGDTVQVRAEELFHEARVLSNYGLEAKAAELLVKAVGLAPSYLEARTLAARVDAALGRHPEAAEHAAVVATLAAESDRPGEWNELASFLVDQGFEFDGDVVLPPAATEEPVAERAAEPADETREAEPVTAEAEPAAEGLDWLDRPAKDAAAVKDAAELFDREEEFFDLAAELEAELRHEDLLDEGFEPQPAEQSLEEIVEGFRKGVAETLAAEDYDTHYNLGIAYREMGLVDEAIGEFQLAAKDPRYLVDCCSLLGACFFEKGFPDLAVKWYERGLESANISEKETLGLLYELGNLYVATGETDQALDTFSEIYGTNSNYRDVVARLAELDAAD